ncbi:MAG TPA: response regulator transcription factor [Thermoanaerobaculia bacterium]|jgi:DNA-binding NarL/FixJ family response regulator|nr:response regulator transcription factor [Thermoanaerobaculia bacterium]
MKLIVADDHAIVRKGFHQIAAMRAGWRVAAEAANAEELLAALRREHFDVLVLDVTLAERSGLELLAQIRRERFTLPVLMMSTHPEAQYAVRSLRAGANGYIQKCGSAEEILDAIAAVASGARYITPRLNELLTEEVTRGRELPHERLSSRELEVFRLIAIGRKPTEIAESLNLSVKTVSTYRTRIMEKTGFKTNADIIGYAIRSSLV